MERKVCSIVQRTKLADFLSADKKVLYYCCISYKKIWVTNHFKVEIIPRFFRIYKKIQLVLGFTIQFNIYVLHYNDNLTLIVISKSFK